MSLSQPRRYRIQAFLEHHLLWATIEPTGALIPYLNNAERKNILLQNVNAIAIDMQTNVDTFKADELWVYRDEIMAIRFFDPVSTTTVPLFPVKDKLRVFLPRLVVQGNFSRSPDTKIGDIFESTSGNWAAATDVRIHPLLPTKAQIAPEAPVLLISKQHIQFYQPLNG
ncbi:MAG: hypothetical protein WHV44_07505 [Anaerolineales bacterium]